MKKMYLKEYQYFNGEDYITFNIIDIDTTKMLITLAVTNTGKISVITYDLYRDSKNGYYFIYGIEKEKIYLNNFETKD